MNFESKPNTTNLVARAHDPLWEESWGSEQLGNLPARTQNAISILFAKYRLVSEVLGIWFLRQAIYNFVHNFLLIDISKGLI